MRKLLAAAILGLSLVAGAAQAQTTTFTYRELERGSPANLARKTFGANGEGFVRLKRETGGGMIYTGGRYFTFAGTPTYGFDRGCEVRRAHATYSPLRRNRAEPPDARLRLDGVWFETAYGRLTDAPAHDNRDDDEDRMNRLCGRMEAVFEMFTARNGEAAGRAMKVIEMLSAGSPPAPICAPAAGDCAALVRRVLAGRLFHVEQDNCAPLETELPPADAIVCQELRFSLSSTEDDHVGVLKARFHETTDRRNQTRVLTLQAVSASEAHYVE